MKKKTKKNRIFINIFIVICFTLSFLAIYKYVELSYEKEQDAIEYEEIKEIYYEEENDIIEENEINEEPIVEEEENELEEEPIIEEENDEETNIVITQGRVVLEKFMPLIAINSDVVGWIKLPGTKIDYPVVQGKDNDYYLNRNIREEESRTASIFMDYRNSVDALDKNTIIYGHNMDNDTMFSKLDNYVDDKVRYDFFFDSGIITFSTKYEEMEWQVFSAYVINVDDFDYLQTDFDSNLDFIKYTRKIKDLSIVKSNIEVDVDDTILTLSTCNHWFLNSRTVVHAKLIKKNLTIK